MRGPSKEQANDLLRRCEDMRRDGRDFSALWYGLLKGHPLVTGTPSQQIEKDRSVFEIRLTTGERLVVEFGDRGVMRSIAIR